MRLRRGLPPDVRVGCEFLQNGKRPAVEVEHGLVLPRVARGGIGGIPAIAGTAVQAGSQKTTPMPRPPGAEATTSCTARKLTACPLGQATGFLACGYGAIPAGSASTVRSDAATTNGRRCRFAWG